jgi:hypothetical protein
MLVGPADCTGKVIKVGDRVAYPLRQGGNLWMQIGEVVGFRPPGRYGMTKVRILSNNRYRVVHHPERMVVCNEEVPPILDSTYETIRKLREESLEVFNEACKCLYQLKLALKGNRPGMTKGVWEAIARQASICGD